MAPHVHAWRGFADGTIRCECGRLGLAQIDAAGNVEIVPANRATRRKAIRHAKRAPRRGRA